MSKDLEAARRAKGPDYTPRTQHLHPDGRPKFINQLIFETSPYLLQHAHNPVDWMAWGDAAFAKAKAEDKPVLLSVGYSTCHWCHVMERESFEDLEIAAYINANYVAIKVDREERPDVDDIYMDAVHLLHGRGGWPMTLLLTPDRAPFFGGTYFPPRTGARGARMGFLEILQTEKTRFTTDRAAAVAQAQTVSRRIQAQAAPARPGNVPGAEVIERAVRDLSRRFEPSFGGFNRRPKFPMPSNYDLLLRYYRRTGDGGALHMVTHSLEHMAAGGIYDHIGGGFHRYSTDQRWLVPHFEKMLYDNAQLVPVYLDAWKLTGREDFAKVARAVLDYVAREMVEVGGGFASATDADSPVPGRDEEEEGWFFTWTPEEIDRLLPAEPARSMKAYYAVRPGGNFEGRSILHTPRSAAVVAAELGLGVEAMGRQLSVGKALLYAHRATRPAPLKDRKVIVAWNGQMIGAFAQGGLALDEPRYLAVAERAADFVLKVARDADGRLLRTVMDGQARHRAQLDDHAFLIAGLLDLFEATGTPRWLREALELQAALEARYLDRVNGGYFSTADDGEVLLARQKPIYDGAQPSGNSITARNLLRLAELTGDAVWRQRAEGCFAAFAQRLAQHGAGSPAMLAALDHYLDTPLQVVVVGGEGQVELLTAMRQVYLPNRAIVLSLDGAPRPALTALVPLAAEKTALHARATAYVCERGRCERPTHDPQVFAQQLRRESPLFAGYSPAPLSVSGARQAN